MENERFQCACGEQFDNRGDLRRHEMECTAAQNAPSGQPKTRQAGGGQDRDS